MLNQEQIEALQTQLVSLDLEFNPEEFASNIRSVHCVDPNEIMQKVHLLDNLINKIKEDDNVKRDAARILANIDKIDVLACLADDEVFFQQQLSEGKIDRFQSMNYTLDAALIGAQKTATLFFKQYNPKDHESILAYAICSGSTEWVKQLVSDWKINISKRMYGFYPSANKVNNQELITFYYRLSPVLSGELLESFNELILSELEMLADIPDQNNKNLLLDILFDSKLLTEDVAQYAEAIDPIFGKRFAIVYCCMHPHKWDEPFMNEYKNIIINSYAERATGEDTKKATLIAERIKWLKGQGNSLLKQFFQAREIKKVYLSEGNIEQKEKRLASIKKIFIDPAEVKQDTELLEADKKSLENLIKAEGETGIFKDVGSVKAIATLFKKETQGDSLLNAWKELTKYDQRWQSIYELIKISPQAKRLRPAEKMLFVVKAILYKEAMHCRWPELPQFFLPATMVRHYYYQWKSSGVLDKIEEIMANPCTINRSLQLK